MTAAPADTVKVMSHLMLLLYSLEFSNSGISVSRPRSPRLLAFGTIVGVVEVDVSDAGDLSPVLGVEALLRDVEGVSTAVFISLLGASGTTSFLYLVSMARVGYLLWALRHETRQGSRVSRGLSDRIYAPKRIRRPSF